MHELDTDGRAAAKQQSFYPAMRMNCDAFFDRLLDFAWRRAHHIAQIDAGTGHRLERDHMNFRRAREFEHPREIDCAVAAAN